MFTGLVRGVGKIASIAEKGGGRSLDIVCPPDFPPPAEGASIACAGVCLTARACSGQKFTADASPETLACSTIGSWRAGQSINLEPSLAAGEEMGGHIVSGHVDAPVKVSAFESQGDFCMLAISAPPRFAPFLAPKGSLALDGVSLTINEVHNKVHKGADALEARFMLIPATLQTTSLGEIKTGAPLNMEIDTLARYAVQAIKALR